MQKTLLASVIVMSLSACDSDSLSVSEVGTITGSENTVVDTTLVDDATDATGTTTDTTGDNTTVVVQGPVSDDAGDGGDTVAISDDAGSATSDGGDTAAADDDKYDTGNSADGNSGSDNDKPVDDKTDTDAGGDTISDDAGSATSDGGDTGTISDDAGSATSDGGQISDDAGSATSDGGQVSDDAGSATSDGGQVSDDAGSSTSDGGTADNGGGTVVDTQGARQTNAGSFTSDNAGGEVIRVSSLVSNNSAEVCTVASNQNNFSDTRIGDFILHNNAWRTFRAAPGYEWEQCVFTNTNGAVAGWNYDWGPGIPGNNGRASDDFYVRSYPELIYGVKDEFRTSAPQSETGLPVFLSDLPNIRIDYSYDAPQFGESRTVDASNNSRFPNGTTISGERNVAIESFYYEPDAAGNCSTGIVTRNGGSNHTFEVMVWLDAGAERLPAGASDFVADLNIRGADYKVYTKASDPRYIAFVAQNPQTTGTIFWNDFTDWARDNSFQVSELFGARSNTVQIQNDWCVANILVGTEIFWGAGNMNIFEWTITQSR